MTAAHDFTQVLAHLRDMSRPFPPTDLYHFSDLAPQELSWLAAAWPEAPVERRRAIVSDLNDISEDNFEVDFEAFFRLGLADEDGEVRSGSIRGLWESEDAGLIAPLLDFMQHDPAVQVRAAAATALGRFVYLGEIEELPAARARRVEEALLAVIKGKDDLEVRRRALEAAAFSRRAEIPALISAAYASPDEQMRVSAVFAMGRSADARWGPQVCAELEQGSPAIRFEAARAAGELELAEAVAGLTQLIADGDRPACEAAIWSLSQVGGPEAQRVLTRLLREADEDEEDFIEDALDNLAFTNDLHDFARFALDEDFDDEDDDVRLN